MEKFKCWLKEVLDGIILLWEMVFYTLIVVGIGLGLPIWLVLLLIDWVMK